MALIPTYPTANSLIPTIARPHSAGPFTNYPVSYRQLALAGDGDSTLDFLAGLLMEQRLRSLDEAAIIEDWVMQCPELDSRYGNPLLHEEVSRAFWNVLQVVDQCQAVRAYDGVSKQLYDMLGDALERDILLAARGNTNVTADCQHLFRALAYVSSKYRSPQLGSILYTWYVDHLQYIVQHNCKRALWQWCHAILDSSMSYDLKQDCLSKLSVHRPDLFRSSEIGGNESAVRQLPQLIEELIDVLRNRRPSYTRSSGHRSSRRGRWSSRERDDAYFYGTRSSRARDEELEDERRELVAQLRRVEDAQRDADRGSYRYQPSHAIDPARYRRRSSVRR